VKLVEELGIGLVAVGSRGKGRIRRLAMGSVSDSVARHARCPVMVVRWKPVVFPAKILLATDASEEARLAATTSSDLAQRTGSELHVAHVGREVTHGALIAVGSRGLGKIGRARLGSVSTKVLQAARGPVLVYPRPGVTLGGVVAEGCVVKGRGKTWPCLGKSERSAGLRSSSPHAQGMIIPTKGRLLINPD
jgi:nucleotide-binding universal stress UspA family protein